MGRVAELGVLGLSHAMKRYRALIIGLLLGACLAGLALNRVWVGLGWDMVYRGDMVYASDLVAQYSMHRAVHGAWPAPEDIVSRLHYRDTTSRGTNRVDRYDCGRYAAYTLEICLSPDGKMEFYCWQTKRLEHKP